MCGNHLRIPRIIGIYVGLEANVEIMRFITESIVPLGHLPVLFEPEFLVFVRMRVVRCLRETIMKAMDQSQHRVMGVNSRVVAVTNQSVDGCRRRQWGARIGSAVSYSIGGPANDIMIALGDQRHLRIYIRNILKLIIGKRWRCDDVSPNSHNRWT
ncbi:hypothetical protein OO17_08035 [Rhodopseudomonas palustris]|uniref:Uncharacterized protein n=1 Tax=Rhodopseudomonas palustris TaxID=1076 RepID=A0A0D7EWU7_RHOPL|nr:hypothetical protein OO17_08035 [Rhodopseudomonas palustris]